MSTPTPEAIEAAAVAMFYQQVGLKPPYPLWDDADAIEKDNCRNDANLALTAAAPFIAAQAKVEALREASEDLDPDLGAVDYHEEPQVNRIISKCSDWLDARADIIENKETSNAN